MIFLLSNHRIGGLLKTLKGDTHTTQGGNDKKLYDIITDHRAAKPLPRDHIFVDYV